MHPTAFDVVILPVCLGLLKHLAAGVLLLTLIATAESLLGRIAAILRTTASGPGPVPAERPA